MLDQARPDSAHCITPVEDDIKTEYHLHSSCATHIDHFNEYGFPLAEVPKPKPPGRINWRPPYTLDIVVLTKEVRFTQTTR